MRNTYKIFILVFGSLLLGSCAEQFREIHGNQGNGGNPFWSAHKDISVSKPNMVKLLKPQNAENNESLSIESSGLDTILLDGISSSSTNPVNVKIPAEGSSIKSPLLNAKDHKKLSKGIQTGISKIKNPINKAKQHPNRKLYQKENTPNLEIQKPWDLGNWFIFLVGIIDLILGAILIMFGLADLGIYSILFFFVGAQFLITGIFGLTYFQKVYNNFKNHSLLFKIAFWMMFLGVFTIQFWLFFVVFYWIMAIIDWIFLDPKNRKL